MAKTNNDLDNEMEGIQNTILPHDSHGITITYHEGVTSVPHVGCQFNNKSSKSYISEDDDTKDEISDNNAKKMMKICRMIILNNFNLFQ